MTARAIRVLETTAGGVRAVTQFSKSFVGFQGHFPGDPILPGFVQVQLALDLLALARGAAVEVAEIAVGRFKLPIRPEEEIAVEIQEMETGAYSCTLTTAAGVASVFELVLQKS